MSGGAFDYQDYRLDAIATELRIAIAKTRKKAESSDYSTLFLNEMIRAYNQVRELSVLLHRIDWVLSGDDGEETYWEQLAEDMATVERDDPADDDRWIDTHTDDG